MKPTATLATAPPIAPMARPMAAKMPANLAMSNGWLEALAAGSGTAPAAMTPWPRLAVVAWSLAAANFAICYSTKFATRL